MRRLTIAFLLTFFLTLSPALAQNWGPDDEKPPAVDTVDLVDESLAAAASDVMGRKGLTLRQRRALGITRPNLIAKLVEMHNAGELKGVDQATLSKRLLSQLVVDNPKGFADPKLDWDSIEEFIDAWLPILLFILSLFIGS